MSSFESDSSEALQSNSSPMVFKISSISSISSDHDSVSKNTFCGVLEFTAPEGIVYVPNWVGRQASFRFFEFFLIFCNINFGSGFIYKLPLLAICFQLRCCYY